MRDEEWLQPEPPDARPVKALPVLRWIATGVLVVALTAAAFFAPIPVFFLYLPGPVRDVENLVEATQAKTYSSEGSLFMTTVSVDTQVTFVELVVAWLDPSQEVVQRDQVTQGQTLDELRDQQESEMRESQSAAKQVALNELGRDRPTGDGAIVVETVEDSPAAGILRADDVIVAVDGEAVETTCDVGRSIDAHDVGEAIVVTVRRNGMRRTFSFELTQNPFEPGPFLGVQMRTRNFQFEPGVEVEFETGKIAGPSAGLMLSLALYDQLTPADLTGGRQIAGTGTIQCDGSVGAIGGIQQKVAGAERKGAEIFLAPQQNFDEALEVAGDIEVVAVARFADALEYLGGLD